MSEEWRIVITIRYALQLFFPSPTSWSVVPSHNPASIWSTFSQGRKSSNPLLPSAVWLRVDHTTTKTTASQCSLKPTIQGPFRVGAAEHNLENRRYFLRSSDEREARVTRAGKCAIFFTPFPSRVTRAPRSPRALPLEVVPGHSLQWKRNRHCSCSQLRTDASLFSVRDSKLTKVSVRGCCSGLLSK